MLDSWSGLDLDRVPHGRRIFASILIDSIGSGLLLPFVPLYFAYRTHASLAVIGALLTAAALIALPAATVAGMVVSRYGASRTIQVINLVRAGAAVCALFSVTREAALVAMFLTTAADNSFWSSNATFVADVALDQRRSWYAVERSARNAALGLGAVTAGVVVSLVGDRGLLWFMAANGASYLVAAGLLLPVRTPSRPARETGDRRSAISRAQGAFSDGRFVVFLLVTVLVTIPLLAFPSILTLTLARHAGWGTSVAGVLIAANVVVIVGGQPTVTRWAGGYPHRSMLVAACASGAVAGLFLAAGFPLPTVLTIGAACVGTVFLTITELLCNATLNDFVVLVAPEAELPHYMAAYSQAWSVAGLVWPVATLPLVQHGSVLTWLTLAGFGLVAAVLALGVPRPASEPASRPAETGADQPPAEIGADEPPAETGLDQQIESPAL